MSDQKGFELTKLKASQNKPTIVKWENGDDELSVRSYEKPRPELYDALSFLKNYVINYLELPSEWDVDLDVTGITITYEDGEMLATITALRTLPNNKVFVINTPHDFIPEKEVAELVEEAQKFVTGERAQGDLFEKAESKDEPVVDDGPFVIEVLNESGIGGEVWEREESIGGSASLLGVRKPLNAGEPPDGAYRIVDTVADVVIEYWVLEQLGESVRLVSAEEWESERAMAQREMAEA